VFVADALLDAFDATRETRCLEMAVSAADYVLNDLYWVEDESTVGLSYPLPSLHTRVHNANLLGAALFSRIFELTGEDRFVEPALKLARYSANKQYPDGSWDYGESSTMRWADNFHTGYNLCALRSIGEFLRTEEFEAVVRRGYRFYLRSFFRNDGAPKYFHDRTYPIDIHSVAQSIITLLTLRDLDRTSQAVADAVLGWAMTHLWDGRHRFYYRRLRFLTIKTSYMRWSQAWMLLALSVYLERQVGQDARKRWHNL